MMSISLLVVTSDQSFGELLRQSLEETKRFGVRVTSQSDAAASFIQETNCPLAFLDATSLEAEIMRVGRDLRQANPRIKFIIVAESSWHSALEILKPEGYLSKPFYLPDLLELMEKLFPMNQGGTAQKVPQEPDELLPWLADVNRAAQHLTRLTFESSAQAALITRNDEMWAYAGQLPQAAAQELTGTVARYWDRRGESDLVRFVRLTTTGTEHMLYATRLATGLVLALVFDAETPFGTIRGQASQLVRSLCVLPEEEMAMEGLEGEVETASIADILVNVPSPNPPRDFKLPPAEFSQPSSPATPKLSDEKPGFSRETSPAVPINPLVFTDDGETVATDLEETIKSTAVTRKSNAQKKDEPVATDLSETRPIPVSEVSRKIVFESVSPSIYNLTYACMLLPRFPQHHLISDLADRLSEWVPQICVAYGWRLEQIAVRPYYLHWIVNVPPATSPGYLMRILRQHTSERFFTVFSYLRKENPSGDFWAPGYLIMGGTQSPPAQLIKEFIQQTRQRQGIS